MYNVVVYRFFFILVVAYFNTFSLACFFFSRYKNDSFVRDTRDTHTHMRCVHRINDLNVKKYERRWWDSGLAHQLAMGSIGTTFRRNEVIGVYGDGFWYSANSLKDILQQKNFVILLLAASCFFRLSWAWMVEQHQRRRRQMVIN